MIGKNESWFPKRSGPNGKTTLEFASQPPEIRCNRSADPCQTAASNQPAGISGFCRGAPSRLPGQRARSWIRQLPVDRKSVVRSRVPISSLRLALTAPREEIGREICRIAVSFRRLGLFLRRIRIWLHHLPIKMPGGMAEQRQNDSKNNEEQ